MTEGKKATSGIEMVEVPILTYNLLLDVAREACKVEYFANTVGFMSGMKKSLAMLRDLGAIEAPNSANVAESAIKYRNHDESRLRCQSDKIPGISRGDGFSSEHEI